MRRLAASLRRETVAGGLLLTAAVVALVCANTPLAPWYFALREHRVGPAGLHLKLTVAEWAADGLLTLFFFLAGLELKREFVVGDLREPRRALVPVIAAVGGMIAPAVVFVIVNTGHGTTSGWAIPAATDIAFSLAVLAVVGAHLPPALRTFLLALAIADDLLAIVIIATVYPAELRPALLVAAVVPIAGFGLLAQLRAARWWAALPLAIAGWALVHASGVHATMAGVLLAAGVPVHPSGRHPGRRALPGSADRLAHQLGPWSAGVVVPTFAFFSAGVAIGGMAALGRGLTQPVTLGVVLGLAVGKPLGVLTATWVTVTCLPATADRTVSWWDRLGVAMLCGMGFTVALLIGALAFPGNQPQVDNARIGVLTGTLIAAVGGGVVVAFRDRHHRRLREA